MRLIGEGSREHTNILGMLNIPCKSKNTFTKIKANADRAERLERVSTMEYDI